MWGVWVSVSLSPLQSYAPPPFFSAPVVLDAHDVFGLDPPHDVPELEGHYLSVARAHEGVVDLIPLVVVVLRGNDRGDPAEQIELGRLA